ncbi:MAG: hypothetical protein ACE5OZ_01095 [Candidatus Heimdallarchaeota archaeon]
MPKIELKIRNLIIIAVILGNIVFVVFNSPVSPGQAETLITSGSVSTSVSDFEYPYHILATATLYWSVYYLGSNVWRVYLTFQGYEREQGETAANAYWGQGSQKMSPSYCEYRSSTTMVTPDGTSFNGDGTASSRVRGGTNNQVIKVVAATTPQSTSVEYVTLTTTPQGGGGGCPYVAPWTGTAYSPENNLLVTSERYWPDGGTDVDDSYHLIMPIVPKGNQYSIAITEFEHEQSFFDTARLMTVDHSMRTQIAVDPHGNILSFKHPHAPQRAIDRDGNNVKPLIRHMDDNRLFLGLPGDTITMLFPKINSDHAKLILRADDKMSIHVQLQNAAGDWLTVEEVHPRAFRLHNEIVDLSQYAVRGQALEVRLLWTGTHFVDFIGLDTTQPSDPLIIQTVSVSSAFDFNGEDITTLLANDDEQYAELLPGQSMILNFPITSQFGFRDFVLFVNGYYVPYAAS